MSPIERNRRDGLEGGAADDLRRDAGGAGGEKLEGFFPKYGSPVPGVGGEKPGEFFTSPPADDSAQVGPKAKRKGISQAPASETKGPRHQLQAVVEGHVAAGVSHGGRPTVITPAVHDRICTLLSVGFSRRQAAAYVDIDHTTIGKMAQRDPEFAASLRRAEEKALLQPMLTVIGEAQKNWRAAAWFIQYKDRQPVVTTEEEKQEAHEKRIEEQRLGAIEFQAFCEAMREEREKSKCSVRKTGLV